MGFDTSDDAAVYKINEETAMIQTVDFFPPVVDDPYVFGQIAAANSLSDVYAMGGEPKTCMNLLSISSCMSMEQVEGILQGGYDKVREAGAIIAGGHTIEDAEPKYGLCVTGFIHPKKVLKNSSAKEGDMLIMTKPLGLGILAGAFMAEALDEVNYKLMCKIMSTLNKEAQRLMMPFEPHACTDVTGFGLLGHGFEMAGGSGLTMEINSSDVPIIEAAKELAKDGIVPAGAYANFEYLKKNIENRGNVPEYMTDILVDPETSGGLLIALPENKAKELLKRLEEVTPYARIIGQMSAKKERSLIIY